MNELMIKTELVDNDAKIENMIYEIRGVQVMLDSDLAILYECKNGTKEINQAVKNNPEKFPMRFSWILSDDEWSNLRSKILTSSQKNNYGGRRYNPRVFSEHGIYMLSTVIKSKIATSASIRIMDTFVNMRKFINENKDIYKSINIINNRLLEHDEKFNYLFSKFDTKEQIFLEGQTYSSYREILKILNSAKKDIIIVDEYADITFLDLIRKLKCNITLITRDSNRLSNIEIEKYNKEYNNLTVIRNNSFHDRFFIIDRNDIYLSGSSINCAGNKTFMIIQIEKESVKNTILKDIDKIINK